jgi:hypothetical protein
MVAGQQSLADWNTKKRAADDRTAAGCTGRADCCCRGTRVGSGVSHQAGQPNAFSSGGLGPVVAPGGPQAKAAEAGVSPEFQAGVSAPNESGSGYGPYATTAPPKLTSQGQYTENGKIIRSRSTSSATRTTRRSATRQRQLRHRLEHPPRLRLPRPSRRRRPRRIRPRSPIRTVSRRPVCSSTPSSAPMASPRWSACPSRTIRWRCRTSRTRRKPFVRRQCSRRAMNRAGSTFYARPRSPSRRTTTRWSRARTFRMRRPRCGCDAERDQ